MDKPEHGHEPVMLAEVLEHLALKPGAVVADCTVGRGGHAVEIAQRILPGGKLLALDVDPDNLKYAKERIQKSEVSSQNEENVRFFQANFAEVDDVVRAAGLELPGLDGLLADLGVSTNQLLEAKHGMSFTADGPLDMRMDPRIRQTAADLLAELDEAKLAHLLHDYAQERCAWKIARKIVQMRATLPIRSTEQLARLVRSVVPAKWGQIDPATRTFQALRMAVNAELESLEDLLGGIPELMKAGGRVVIISFHSGEDRLVKHAMKEWASEGWCKILTKKPLEASDAEGHRNPRSRSAKMRVVEFN